MTDHVLVHFNTVRPVTELSFAHEEVQFFVSALPGLFQDADRYGGILWHKHAIRLNDGTFLDPLQALSGIKSADRPPNIVTMAAWTGFKELHGFSHRRRNHVEGMKKLRHWVDRSEGPTLVLWWDDAGREVGLDEGWSRLERLRKDGPGLDAFSLQQRFGSPSSQRGAA